MFVSLKFVAATFHRSDLAQLYATFCQLTINPLTLMTKKNRNYLMPVNCIPKFSIFFVFDHIHSHTQSIYYIYIETYTHVYNKIIFTFKCNSRVISLNND